MIRNIQKLSRIEFITLLIIAILLLFSIAIFFYTYYKSEIVWNGKKSDYYNLYYSISLIFIIINSTLLFANSLLQRYFVIIVLSIIFATYLVEAYFTLVQLKQKNFALIKNENNQTYQAYLKFKNGDKNVRVPVPPSFYHFKKNTNFYPLSGVSNSVTINCNEAGYYSMYESDKYGFNNPNYVWDNYDVEYALFGDSFVLGDCVNRPHDIASVLRSLTKKNTINLGYKGNSPLAQLATVKEYIQNGFKNIIWFYYEGNDLQGLAGEIQIEILKNYLEDKFFQGNLLNHKNFSQNLIFNQNKIDKINNVIIERNKNKIISRLSKPGGNHFIGIEYSNNNYSLKYFIKRFIKLYNLREKLHHIRTPENFLNSVSDIPIEFEQILLNLKYLSKKNHSNLYFVYLPEFKRYTTNYENENYIDLKEMINKLNINFIDININNNYKI